MLDLDYNYRGSNNTRVVTLFTAESYLRWMPELILLIDFRLLWIRLLCIRCVIALQLNYLYLIVATIEVHPSAICWSVLLPACVAVIFYRGSSTLLAYLYCTQKYLECSPRSSFWLSAGTCSFFLRVCFIIHLAQQHHRFQHIFNGCDTVDWSWVVKLHISDISQGWGFDQSSALQGGVSGFSAITTLGSLAWYAMPKRTSKWMNSYQERLRILNSNGQYRCTTSSPLYNMVVRIEERWIWLWSTLFN